MRVPAIRGVIERRLLVNFRVDADALARQVPEPFEPLLVGGVGVAGICLIRLAQIRPVALPGRWGVGSENAAHRIAVRFPDGDEGVYIPRRDTNSRLNTLLGGRLFPGVHHLEAFSSSIHHVGSNGAGLEMKLITNRLLTAHLVSIGEAILEMENAGLDTAACIELLREGAVPRLLDYKAAPMSRRDHAPLFTVDLMAKDLGLADARRAAGPVNGAAAAILRQAQDRGWGSSDIGAVIEVLGAED